MNDNNKQPEYQKSAFNCPWCHAYANQSWNRLSNHNQISVLKSGDIEFRSVLCANCEKISIWEIELLIDEPPITKMIYPLVSNAPLPNEHMPEDVKSLFNEARVVAVHSDRAAAALLRVSLEKLTEYLGEKEGSLNTRIGKLKEKGFPSKVIQSLDIIRINANEGGSHAGSIDLTGKDNADIVNKLFWLVNFIVVKTIQDNKEIDNMFMKLP